MKNHWMNKNARNSRLVKIATDSGFNFAWVLDLVESPHTWHHIAVMPHDVYIDGVPFRRNNEESLVEQ